MANGVNWGNQRLQPNTPLNIQPGIQNYFQAQQNARMQQTMQMQQDKARRDREKQENLQRAMQESMEITPEGVRPNKKKYVSNLYNLGLTNEAFTYEQQFDEEERKKSEAFMTKQKMLLQAKGDIFKQNEPYLRALTDPKERANLLKDSYKQWKMDGSQLPDELTDEFLDQMAQAQQFAPNKFQQATDADLNALKFDPSTGEYSQALLNGEPFKRPQTYTNVETPEGYVQLPTKTPTQTAPDPIKDLTPAGKKKRELEEKKVDLQIIQAGVNLKKAIKMAKDGGQFKVTQYEASGYGIRMKETEEVMDQLNAEGFDRTKVTLALLNKGPELMKSGPLKRYVQAQRSFINATLRRESGAAIAQSEFDNAEVQYFPAVGDDAATLAQKKKNREVVHAMMRAEAGGAWTETISHLADIRNNNVQPITSNPVGGKKKKRRKATAADF